MKLSVVTLAVLVALACQPSPPQPLSRALDTGTLALVANGATWQFLDDGAVPAMGWQTPPPDDASWRLGLAPFGYGQGDEATKVGFGVDPAKKPLVNYYRIALQIPDPARVQALRLRILHDDGAVAYLGGKEIYRRNLPAGAVDATTPASTPAPAATVEQAIDPALLQAGANVLAVEVHQDGPASATHRFDLALEATEAVAVTRGPYLQSASSTQVTVRWRLVPPFAGRLSYGTSPGALTSTMDDAVGVDHAVTITGLSPGTRYFYAVGTPAQALAGGDGFSFVTPPAAAAPTRIWVLGDSGNGNADAARVRDAYRAFAGTRPTDLWLMLGDNAYPRGTDEEHQRALFDFFPDFLRSNALWPALGNADILCCEGRPDAIPYLDVFTLPAAGEAGGVASGSELYYSFDHGDLHVVVLDSTLSDRKASGPMLTWLGRDLDANHKIWLIAVWHHPPYTRGEHDSDAEGSHIQMRENALPILEQHGVDLVLGGHSHDYERSMLLDGHYGLSTTLTPAMKKDPGPGPYRKQAGPHGGAVFVVLGDSSQLSPGPLDHPVMVVNSLSLGSLVLDVQGSQLDATFLRDTGAVGDRFTIVKTPAPAVPDAGADAGVPKGDSGCSYGGRGRPGALALLVVAAIVLRRRWSRACLVAVASLGLAACHDESPSVGAGPPPDGGADAASGCESVCWHPMARPPNPVEGETATFVSEECRCPQGFACTGSKTVTSPRLTSTYPVCQPLAQRRPVELAFDFRSKDPTVPVGLRFKLNGGAWPRSAVAESAGQITITLEQQEQRILPLPTDESGLLTVPLPRGRHQFQLELGRGDSFDPFKYPITNLAGALVVERAGEVTIDLQAPPVTFALRLNGAPFPAPATGEAVALRIEGRTAHRLQVKRGAGQTLDHGTIWLEPGKYVVTLTTESPFGGTLPSGFVILDRSFEVGTAPLETTFDAGMFTATGGITVDGKDLPASADAEIDLIGHDGESRATVPATRPAHYRILAYRGQYDLELATATRDSAAGIPSGDVRVLEKKTIDGDLTSDIAVTTVPWPVEITSNGLPVADSPLSRGKLQLAGGLGASFELGPAGPVRLTPLVYQGTASQVTVVGASSGPLPAFPVPVASALTTAATPAKLDVPVAPVTVALHLDSGDPPAAAVPRGFFRFSRADGTPGEVSVNASSSGPLTATLNLTPGTWSARFQANGEAAGTPAGDLALPDLIVPKEGLSRTVEVATVEAVVEFRQNGGALPDAVAGRDRGQVQIGSTRIKLPATGPARLALRIFPGVTSVAVVCAGTCGAGLPQFLTLTPFVAVGN